MSDRSTVGGNCVVREQARKLNIHCVKGIIYLLRTSGVQSILVAHELGDARELKLIELPPNYHF